MNVESNDVIGTFMIMLHGQVSCRPTRAQKPTLVIANINGLKDNKIIIHLQLQNIII